MSNGSLAAMALMLMVFAYLKLRKTKGAAAALIFALVLGMGGLITEMRPAVADAQSCDNCDRAANAKPTIMVTKALAGAGRFTGTDQFTVQVLQAGNPVNNTANSTTSGTGAVVDAGSGTTGVIVATAGTAYTLGETISGPGASLSNYTISVSCTNATAGGTNVSGITTLGGTLTPALGDVISCTITNSPNLPPTIVVNKALNGSRANNTDQFTVQIMNGATVVNPTANSTTLGTGSSVTAGSGTTGVVQVVAGTTYTLNEVMTSGNIGQYNSALSCTNTLSVANGGTNVSGINTLGTSISPVANDAIACTLTNTPMSATLTVIQFIVSPFPVNLLPPFTFNYTGTNGWQDQLVTSSVFNLRVSGQAQNLTALNTAVTLSTTLPEPRWQIFSFSCKDANAAITGNSAATLVTVTSPSVTIPAANVRAGAVLNCTLFMGHLTP